MRGDCKMSSSLTKRSRLTACRSDSATSRFASLDSRFSSDRCRISSKSWPSLRAITLNVLLEQQPDCSLLDDASSNSSSELDSIRYVCLYLCGCEKMFKVFVVTQFVQEEEEEEEDTQLGFVKCSKANRRQEKMKKIFFSNRSVTKQH